MGFVCGRVAHIVTDDFVASLFSFGIFTQLSTRLAHIHDATTHNANRHGARNLYNGEYTRVPI